MTEQTIKRIEAVQTLGRDLAQVSPGSIEWLEAANIGLQILLHAEYERLEERLKAATTT